MIESPAKVMRIGSMVKQLLDEVRSASLDEAGRTRLREIYELSVRELSTALSNDLSAELDRMAIPFGEGVPSESELRVAQAQLVGWLEGLFHGIQADAMAQQRPPAPSSKRCASASSPGPGEPAGPGHLPLGAVEPRAPSGPAVGASTGPPPAPGYILGVTSM